MPPFLRVGWTKEEYYQVNRGVGIIMAMEQQPRNERRAGGLLCPTCGLVQTHERIFAMAAFGKVAGLGRKAKVIGVFSHAVLIWASVLRKY